VDLILMRDIFHCTPSELYEQDAESIAGVLAMLEAEATVKRIKRRSGRGGQVTVDGADG